jgi:Mrp family chromosome partitioning ATPase
MPDLHDADALIDDALFDASYPIKGDPSDTADDTPTLKVRFPVRYTPPIMDVSVFPDTAASALLLDRCRQFCFATFLNDQAPIRSMGITSSIPGEGKTFFASMIASILAEDTDESVTLVECNWDNPSLHTQYHIEPTPGLAEWLRGESDGEAISHRVASNFSVIPCGDGKRDAVKLLQRLQGDRLRVLGSSSKFLVFDLPPVASCAYGRLAASLADALVIVVRAGVTPDFVIADTCRQLQDFPVHGIMLNQVKTRVPRWLRKLI